MTYCTTYIGDLDDPSFKWEGGDWSGNIPRNIGPVFPLAPEYYNARFHAWVAESGVTCKQTDYGGWVARVSKTQIVEYISFCYERGENADVIELLAFVTALYESKQYGLVAEEY